MQLLGRDLRWHLRKQASFEDTWYVFQQQGARGNRRPNRDLMRSAKERERGICGGYLDHNGCSGTGAAAAVLIRMNARYLCCAVDFPGLRSRMSLTGGWVYEGCGERWRCICRRTRVMLITEEYVRDWLPVCSRETDRRRSVLAIAGKDCAITLVSRCWESLGLNVNSATWQQRFLCSQRRLYWSVALGRGIFTRLVETICGKSNLRLLIPYALQFNQKLTLKAEVASVSACVMNGAEDVERRRARGVLAQDIWILHSQLFSDEGSFANPEKRYFRFET
ncbi:uncharacterized protein LOC141933677 [Strix aluco]|uniref:uncharacterized protein LOC141933677 n=1 Tax=Strix aluco TaxID=111821 RepID=UPI003DA2A334